MAEWQIKFFPEDSSANPPGASMIGFKDCSSEYANCSSDEPKQLAEVLAQLRADGRVPELRHLVLHELVFTDEFQAQLLEVLESKAAEELSAAKESSGNMHNPALRPLARVLPDMVLSVPVVQDISDDLGQIGLRIGHVSFEKLFLPREESHTKIVFMLWLSVEQV